MLSKQEIDDRIECVSDHNIEKMIMRTGCGLLSDQSKIYNILDKPYMGLEGHTESQSIEAVKDINMQESLAGETYHKHEMPWTVMPGAERPESHDMHNSGFRHYSWQITTIAPLYIEITRPRFEETEVVFVQPLPMITNDIPAGELPFPFSCHTSNGTTFLHYPYNAYGTMILPLDSFEEVYRQILRQSTKLYYLHCMTLSRMAVHEFKYTYTGLTKNHHQ